MTEGETKNATKKRKDKERIEELTGQKRVPLTGGETTLKSVILAHLTMGMSCLCFSFLFFSFYCPCTLIESSPILLSSTQDKRKF